MELGEGTRLGLEQLLKECSAHLSSEAGRGTGFFVDDRHLLTSAHVVGKQEGLKVQVQPFTRAVREGTVIAVQPEETDDLALVEVEPIDGEESPSVVFARELADGIEYFAVGHPKGDLVEDVGLEGIKYTGHQRTEIEEGEASLLKLEAGRAAVTPGMSGGPVLSTGSGGVVAIMQYNTLPDTNMGGGAIPVGRAADAFEVVRDVLEEPPSCAHRWRELLGSDAWQTLGYRWGWKRVLDVRITGTRKDWEVQIDPDDDAPRKVTTEGLPTEVFRALFSWAERRPVRDADDVDLLGSLLAGALFPSQAASKLFSDRLDDELLLRLHFDSEGDLFDVPWEFLTLKAAEEDHHVAAHQNMGLVRVGRHKDPAQVQTAPCETTPYVLGILIEPDEYQAMPRLSERSWPRPEEILDAQRDAVEQRGTLWFKGLMNPAFDELDDQTAGALVVDGKPIEDASMEVVHYTGFGCVENGKPSLAFGDGEGGIYWREATDFFDWTAAGGARLLVVEFMLSPLAVPFEALAPKTFLAALTNRVNATVFTRFPLHTRELSPFNQTLYAALGQSKSIERAVQLARKKVDDRRAIDAAGFGAFSLITGDKAGMRLVPAEAGDAAEGMSAQERGAARPRVEAATRPAGTFTGAAR